MYVCMYVCIRRTDSSKVDQERSRAESKTHSYFSDLRHACFQLNPVNLIINPKPNSKSPSQQLHFNAK